MNQATEEKQPREAEGEKPIVENEEVAETSFESTVSEDVADAHNHLLNLLKTIRRKDPAFDFYMIPTTTAAERDVVYRATMYFARLGPRSTPPPYATVLENLDPNISMIGNGTVVAPVSARFASGKQIGNFLEFLEAHKGPLGWVGNPIVRFYCRIENSRYFPVRY